MSKRKLHVQKGTDEVNFDGKLYRVDNNGDVEVPVEAIEPLLKVGGCTIDDDTGPDPDGFVRVRHNGDATSCSWGSATYEARPDGTFLIPAVAADDLSSHGFVGVEEVDADPAPAPEKVQPVPKLKIPAK
ncbi:MAG TPA: hypothetical protein VEF90_16530 [Xanthobacteraceae bacterium]|nr:hypothetical protein [Xanthobacteraceae bacterium]